MLGTNYHGHLCFEAAIRIIFFIPLLISFSLESRGNVFHYSLDHRAHTFSRVNVSMFFPILVDEFDT